MVETLKDLVLPLIIEMLSKKNTQVEEVLGSEQTRHNAFFANDVILVQVQVTDFNF